MRINGPAYTFYFEVLVGNPMVVHANEKLKKNQTDNKNRQKKQWPSWTNKDILKHGFYLHILKVNDYKNIYYNNVWVPAIVYPIFTFSLYWLFPIYTPALWDVIVMSH